MKRKRSTREELVDMVLSQLPHPDNAGIGGDEYRNYYEMALMYAREGDRDLATSEMLFAEKVLHGRNF